jgi:hypothetical protein
MIDVTGEPQFPDVNTLLTFNGSIIVGVLIFLGFSTDFFGRSNWQFQYNSTTVLLTNNTKNAPVLNNGGPIITAHLLQVVAVLSMFIPFVISSLSLLDTGQIKNAKKWTMGGLLYIFIFFIVLFMVLGSRI